MKKLLLLFVVVTFFNCSFKKEQNLKVENNPTDKISVLNFATAHLSYTSDAKSANRNLDDKQVKIAINKILTCLVNYKPTIICIEMQPDNNEFVNETYQKYIINQSNRLNYSDEINSIGLETGRLSGVHKIYGIDSQIGFDYPSLIAIANKKKSDSLFVETIMKSYDSVNSLPIFEQFIKINSSAYKSETFNFYNFLATMHSENNFEGADIIADFYKRNLRMYANFCDIPLQKNDRVLIILGATHTAYFDIFLENNPKYKLENIADYLK